MNGKVVFFPVAGEDAFSPDEYVTRALLADKLKVSESQIDRWRKRDRDPLPSVSWGKRLVRFNVGQAKAWLEREERAA